MDPQEHSDSGEETALLPKSIFGDKTLEPGATCKFKVVQIYDDEVEVAYVKHEKDGDKEKDYSPEEQIDRAAMPGNMEMM
jgi:hypothetical protein